MTVGEIKERMSSEELTEWMQYYEICPFGEERHDINAALIAQTIANVNRSKDQPAYKLEDFMITFDKEVKEPDYEKQYNEIKRLYGNK